MPARAIFGPRRVATTPATLTSHLYGDSELEQEQLINPYESQAAAYDVTQNIVENYEYSSEETYKHYHDTGAGEDQQHVYTSDVYQYPDESYYDNRLTMSGDNNEFYDSTTGDAYTMQSIQPAANTSDFQHSNVGWSESEMPYLEPMDAVSKEAISSTHSDDEANQTVLGLLSSAYGPSSTALIQPASSNSEEYYDDGEKTYYGHIPQRRPRRYNTIKRVPLDHGHLVLDCPIPPKLHSMLPIREGREFSHMRYTALTCDPDRFVSENYSLRQILYDPPRPTEICIILTLYNEDDKLFTRTMHGVMTNIAYLCSLKKHATWGPDSWKKVSVVIIADGRMKIHSRVLSVLAAMGIYQEGVGKNTVQDVPVVAHMYEYTTQISVDPSLKFRSAERGIVPVQILLCIKEHNQKKINSHRWAFNAFSAMLQPRVCILIDVGTMPKARSIYRLWEAFDQDENVGGACGEIVALKGKMGHALANPLVAAQNFEYKLSNVLDKPMESAFGYISVLPGAFSAYRYEALQNDAMGHGPLSTYFKGEKLYGGHSDADIFTKNMYLAEDRVLCWELVTKRNASWVLRFVKRAHGETDVPTQIPELISQRRRWLNGSFFAAIHSIIKFNYIYRSNHSLFRKTVLHIEMVYQLVQLLFSWFSLANYYLTFKILAESMTDVVHWLHIPSVICEYVYLAILIYCFLLSMGNRPQGNRNGYLFSMIIFALLMLYMMVIVIYLAYVSVRKEVDNNQGIHIIADGVFIRIVVSVLSTFGIWLISSILFVRGDLFTISLTHGICSLAYSNFCSYHPGTSVNANPKLY